MPDLQRLRIHPYRRQDLNELVPKNCGPLLTFECIRSTTVSGLSAAVKGREHLLTEEILEYLEKDPRSGARSLAGRTRRAIAAAAREHSRLETLCLYEQKLWDRGITRIGGTDEAGAGPLAGPVVAAAVIFPPGLTIPGVDDSKKLSPARRKELAREIKEHAVSWATGLATPGEIDEINIYQASLLAMRRAVKKLNPSPEHLLIDARELKSVSLPQTSINQGDSKSFTIASASILAKTHRDLIMLEMDKRHPEYGFARHKGYPTLEHREALQRFGPTPEHRHSFTFKKVNL